VELEAPVEPVDLVVSEDPEDPEYPEYPEDLVDLVVGAFPRVPAPLAPQVALMMREVPVVRDARFPVHTRIARLLRILPLR